MVQNESFSVRSKLEGVLTNKVFVVLDDEAADLRETKCGWGGGDAEAFTHPTTMRNEPELQENMSIFG